MADVKKIVLAYSGGQGDNPPAPLTGSRDESLAGCGAEPHFFYLRVPI